MIIFDDINRINNIDDTVIALGNFDGIHLGHKEIIKRCVDAARSAGMKAGVFTFSNHPRNYFNPGSVRNIVSEKDKLDIIASLGVDYIFNIEFNRLICEMIPEDYVDELLIKRFNMKEVYCGFNYRFGHMAAGDTHLLMELSLEKGFGIHAMEPYKVKDKVVSSTAIREYIMVGRMQEAAEMLGRRYRICGIVEHGNEIGRTIGFPTANIKMDPGMVPPKNGVYATSCIINGKTYAAVTNVGVKPTIGEYDVSIETHIFDFDKDIYEQYIIVEFVALLRPEQKFAGIEELKNQIKIDCVKAKVIHRTF